MVKHRCWFDYNSDDPSCSPYLGMLRALEKRKAAISKQKRRSPARHINDLPATSYADLADIRTSEVPEVSDATQDSETLLVTTLVLT